MIVNFILPCFGGHPIGGLKVVYEYANRLAEDGYKVNLIHSSAKHKTQKFFDKIRNYVRYERAKLTGSFKPVNWFPIHKNINLIVIPEMSEKFIPDSDKIIATSWETATPVFSFSKSKGDKFYFIQSYEVWSGSEELVNQTWRYPMKKIVIAKWLQLKADEMGLKTIYIPNGFDLDRFFITNQIEDRCNRSVIMMYHTHKVKGSEYALNAIESLKVSYPDLKLSLFGITPRPGDLKPWIEYYSNPEQEKLRELYNRNAIFISPSLVEGFPLPPGEAMLCGCCCIASDIKGHKEYCYDNDTAFLFAPNNPGVLEEKLREVMESNNKRIDIAKKGNEVIKQFQWEASYKKFEDYLHSS